MRESLAYQGDEGVTEVRGEILGMLAMYEGVSIAPARLERGLECRLNMRDSHPLQEDVNCL
jgi:hypothetical protein